MLGLMGFSGSLPLYVIHRYYIFVFIDRPNKDACLLACLFFIFFFSMFIGFVICMLNLYYRHYHGSPARQANAFMAACQHFTLCSHLYVIMANKYCCCCWAVFRRNAHLSCGRTDRELFPRNSCRITASRIVHNMLHQLANCVMLCARNRQHEMIIKSIRNKKTKNK